MPESLENIRKRVQLKRARAHQRLVRGIQNGSVNGKILPNGACVVHKPKGIQNWYTTAELKKLVTEQFDLWEKSCGVRKCPIINKWNLQIRGKHLRRLLKAMPNVEQHGRSLVEVK